MRGLDKCKCSLDEIMYLDVRQCLERLQEPTYFGVRDIEIVIE